jgi:hypothetical protein
MSIFIINFSSLIKLQEEEEEIIIPSVTPVVKG